MVVGNPGNFAAALAAVLAMDYPGGAAQGVFGNGLLFADGSQPSTPASGELHLYAADQDLFYKRADGTIASVGGGGGGGDVYTDQDNVLLRNNRFQTSSEDNWIFQVTNSNNTVTYLQISDAGLNEYDTYGNLRYTLGGDNVLPKFPLALALGDVDGDPPGGLVQIGTIAVYNDADRIQFMQADNSQHTVAVLDLDQIFTGNNEFRIDPGMGRTFKIADADGSPVYFEVANSGIQMFDAYGNVRFNLGASTLPIFSTAADFTDTSAPTGNVSSGHIAAFCEGDFFKFMRSDDSVHTLDTLEDTQTVSGEKTFTNNVTADYSSGEIFRIGLGTSDSAFQVMDSEDNLLFQITESSGIKTANSAVDTTYTATNYFNAASGEAFIAASQDTEIIRADENGLALFDGNTTGIISLYDGIGTSQWDPIADPSGGVVQDDECRAALAALLENLRDIGILDI